MPFNMRIYRKLLLLTVLAFIAVPVYPQHPVLYTLHVDTADLSGYKVEMLIPHPPAVTRLAMATHHEYDDRWWRFIEDFKVETAQGVKCSWTREDSAVWKISATGVGADLKISYRVHFP